MDFVPTRWSPSRRGSWDKFVKSQSSPRRGNPIFLSLFRTRESLQRKAQSKVAKWTIFATVFSSDRKRTDFWLTQCFSVSCKGLSRLKTNEKQNDLFLSCAYKVISSVLRDLKRSDYFWSHVCSTTQKQERSKGRKRNCTGSSFLWHPLSTRPHQ